MLDNEDKPLLPAQLEVTSDTSAFLTLTEGRYHQVRRMFAALGNHVTALHRDRIGALALPDDLAAGAVSPARRGRSRARPAAGQGAESCVRYGVAAAISPAVS